MFNSINNDEDKNWLPYIVGMTATAILSALGAKLVEWGIDELRAKYGSKKLQQESTEPGSVDPGSKV